MLWWQQPFIVVALPLMIVILAAAWIQGGRFRDLGGWFGQLGEDLRPMRHEMAAMQQQMAALQAQFAALQQEVANPRHELKDFRQDVVKRLDRLEGATLQSRGPA